MFFRQIPFFLLSFSIFCKQITQKRIYTKNINIYTKIFAREIGEIHFFADFGGKCVAINTIRRFFTNLMQKRLSQVLLEFFILVHFF